MKKFFSYFIYISCFFIIGCVFHPSYKISKQYNKQNKVVPDHQKAKPIVPIRWWQNFDDSNLNNLIEKALSKNKDLKITKARLHEVRMQRLNVASVLSPQVNLNANASRANRGGQSQNITQTIYDASFDASFELDLFGGNRQKLKAADAVIMLYQAEYTNLSLTMIAEIAREYATWRELQQQLLLTENILAVQIKVYQLNETLFKAGLTSNSAVLQAEAIYHTTSAQLPKLKSALKATGYRLAVLIGDVSCQLETSLDKIEKVPLSKDLKILELPLETISSRPDVRAAGYSLVASTALHQAALKEVYPKITLSALLGTQHSNVLPGHMVWSTASSLVAPMLNFGSIKSKIQVTKSRQIQAFHTYKKTLLQALAEVYTNLSNYEQEKHRRCELTKSLLSNQLNLKMAQVRYEQGIVSLFEVLNAEQSVFKTSIGLEKSIANEMRFAIALYKSLSISSIEERIALL